jgi:malonyl-CoA O-methyltransferase
MYNRQMISNFNRHAATYDRYAVVQKEMARILCDTLARTGKSFPSIYEAGCGTGLFSRLLMDQFRPVEIRLNDISHAMLAEARIQNRACSFTRVEYAEGDIEETDPGKELDLYAANAVFQWIPDLNSLFARIRACLRPGGTLGFNLFLPGTFHELKESFIKAFDSPGMNADAAILGFTREEDILRILAENRFKVLHLFKKDHVQKYHHPKDFLQSLKNIGAAHFTDNRLPLKVMRRMMDHYVRDFADEKGMVPATYKVLYCVAEKAP